MGRAQAWCGCGRYNGVRLGTTFQAKADMTPDVRLEHACHLEVNILPTDNANPILATIDSTPTALHKAPPDSFSSQEEGRRKQGCPLQAVRWDGFRCDRLLIGCGNELVWDRIEVG